MQKSYQTIQDYHDVDQDISFLKYDRPSYRVGLLTERSSDVTFTSTSRNAVVVDLSGTERHLTRMDSHFDEVPTRSGDVCLIPPGLEVRFAWETLGDQQHTIMVEFDSDLLETHVPEFAQDRLARGYLLPGGYAPRPALCQIAHLLADEVYPNRRRGRLFVDTAMRLMVLEIAASHWSVRVPKTTLERGPDVRIKRAIDFIEARFCDDISLAEISHASGLSLTQLTARFQQHTGSTPYSYVIDRRLRQATHLLATTDTPIAHVAIETGFSDQQHMTRAFKARLGRTPSRVRKE